MLLLFLSSSRNYEGQHTHIGPWEPLGLLGLLMALAFQSWCGHAVTHRRLWAPHPLSLSASAQRISLGAHFISCIDCAGHPDNFKGEQCGSVGDRYTGPCSSRYSHNQRPFHCCRLEVTGPRMWNSCQPKNWLWLNSQRKGGPGKADREAEGEI